MSKKTGDSGSNIYELLLEASDKKKKEKQEKRAELLKAMKVNEYFEEGKVKIDMKTCRGIECNLCVKACPTNALYWKTGEIGIVEDVCVYCSACVFNCVVDNCIKVTRKRSYKKTEKFSTAKDVLTLLRNIGSEKRSERLKTLFPTVEDYFKRYS
jgi:Fe-S-cluster-containing hydrogenase component 2